MWFVSRHFGNPIVYWIIIIFLYLVLFITGYKAKFCNKKDYWKICFPAIMLYSIIEGIRYGRGTDFFHYMYDLQNGVWTDYSELVYLLWIKFYHSLSIPYYWGFIFYSALFIIGFLFIAKDFKKFLWISLPLMFYITQPNTENLIRQCLAVSFIMIGYAFYLKKNRILSFTCMLIAPLIHSFALFPVVIYGLCIIPHMSRYLSRYPWVYPLLFSITYFFWDISLFDKYIPFISSLDLGENRLQLYIEQADTKFTSDSKLIHIVYGSVIYLTIKYIFTCYVLYKGVDIIKVNPRYTFIYIATFLTFFFSVFSCGIEIWERFGFIFEFAVPIVLGFILINRTKFKYIDYIYCLFLAYLYLYPLLINIGNTTENGCGFIWDK